MTYGIAGFTQMYVDSTVLMISTILSFAFDIERTMGTKVPYVKEVMDVGRSVLGSLYSYDLIVELPNDDEAKEPENLKHLDELQQQVAKYDLTKLCLYRCHQWWYL